MEKHKQKKNQRTNQFIVDVLVFSYNKSHSVARKN